MVAALQPLYRVYHVNRLFRGEDTRTLARRYILDRVPSGTTLALQSYSVPLPQSAGSFRAALEANGALSELERRGKYRSLLEVAEKEPAAYELFFFGDGEEKNRIYVSYEELASGLEPLRERGVAIVVLRRPPVPPAPAVEKLFHRVRGAARLVATISPFGEDGDATVPYLDNEDWPPGASLSNKGPAIEIWSLEPPESR